MRWPRLATIYRWSIVGGVVLAATAIFVYWAWAWRGPLLVASEIVVQLIVLAAVAIYFPLLLGPRYKVSVVVAVYVAALLLCGMPVALAIVLLGQLAGGFTLFLRRNPTTGSRLCGPRDIIFNAARLVLATGLGGLVYYTLLPQTAPAPLQARANLWALPATAITIYLVTSFTATLMAVLQRSERPVQGWWTGGRAQDLLAFAGLFALGLIAALTTTVYPWAPLLLAVPAALIYFSLKRTMQLAKQSALATGALEEAAALRERYNEEHVRRVTELTALHEAGQALAGPLEPRQMYQALLGALRAVVACDRASLYTLEESGALRPTASLPDLTDPAPAGSPTATPMSGALTRRIAKSQALDLPGPERNPGTAPRHVLVVPLLSAAQTRGCIALSRAGAEPFRAHERQLVEAIAAQAAVTVHNTRLYAQVARAAADLRAVLDSIEQGVLMTDRAGQIRFANRRLAELLDLKSLEQFGRFKREANQVNHVKQGITGQKPTAQVRRPAWLGAQSRETKASTDQVTRTPPETRVLERYTGPIRDPVSKAVMGQIEVYTDVTVARRLEQARDEFLAIASHELKTPIMTIGGYLELLQRQIARPDGPSLEHLGRYASTAQAELQRLRRLSEDLLEVARIEAGRLNLRPEVRDISATVRETVERFVARPELRERGHAIVCDASEPLPACYDPLRLGQVLNNLIENALKYSPAGGEVRVTVRRVDDEALIQVRDHGVGIPPAAREKVFEPFYRTEHASSGSPEGLGLGLYISRGIVERHGGQLWVDPAPGGGSIFQLRLPLNRRNHPTGNLTGLGTPCFIPDPQGGTTLSAAAYRDAGL